MVSTLVSVGAHGTDGFQEVKVVVGELLIFAGTIDERMKARNKKSDANEPLTSQAEFLGEGFNS